MPQSGLFLPIRNVISLSTPSGDLELFSSGWRMTFPTDPAARQVSFHLITGGTLQATIPAQSEAALWGNQQGFWLSNASALQLLAALEPVAAGGGLPIPIG